MGKRKKQIGRITLKRKREKRILSPDYLKFEKKIIRN